MKKTLVIFLLLPVFVEAQIITTIAGTGIGTFSGDGMPATVTAINGAVHTAMDGAGNLYFSDYFNERIRKINSLGIVTTVAGTGSPGYSGDGGLASAASIHGPTGILLDSYGNLYFADWFNFRVRKISTTGIITTIAGTGSPGYSGDGGPATSAEISKPWGIAMDDAGDVYFSDEFNNCIRKISTSGIISTIAGTGTIGFSGDSGLAVDAQLYQPVDLVFDHFGNLYFSDYQNNRIRKVSTSGIIYTIGGNGVPGYSGDGGPAIGAELNNPVGISLDTAGNIYIGDYLNNRVRKINSSGTISTIAGTGLAGFSGDGGPAISAQLNGLQGVSVYGSGDLYVCDVYNYRIRKFSSNVVITNHPPSFTGGNVQSLNVCVNEADPTVPINYLLAVIDSDSGQTETWSLVVPPLHGAALASYTTTSTGGILTPIGLTYTPASGYIGTDMFKVSITDGFVSDTTTINITVNTAPDAGAIIGIDSVCPGDTVYLSETVTSGIWSTSNTSVSTVNNSGALTGFIPGNDTVIYTVINSCGIVSAIFPFYVNSYSDCHTGINQLPYSGNEGIKIYPNPNNGVFTVSFVSNTTEDIRFIITNILGEKKKEFTLPSNYSEEVKIIEPAGIYFIAATNSHNRFIEKEVNVER